MKEKFLYLPVAPYYLTQGFGLNRACISNADNKTVVSKEQNATCPAGYRSMYASTNGHNGLDLRAARWQPVYAAQSGIVNEVNTEEARGLGVGIVHDVKKRFCVESCKPEHFKTRYWHFISLNVHVGDNVRTGDLIGYADSTGFSSGDHLHFELKPVKIEGYENGIPYTSNVLQNNTHLGSIDPLPYMDTKITALDVKKLSDKIAWLKEQVALLLVKYSDRLRY